MSIKSKKINNTLLTIARASSWATSQSTAFREGKNAHKYWAASVTCDGLVYEPIHIFKTIRDLIAFYKTQN